MTQIRQLRPADLSSLSRVARTMADALGFNLKSWKAGHAAGLAGIAIAPPPECDRLSWLSGYTEGRAVARARARSAS